MHPGRIGRIGLLPIAAAVIAAAAYGDAIHAQRDDSPRELQALQWQPPELQCSTGLLIDGRWRVLAALDVGEPAYFTQVPPILTPDYAGDVRFRDFLVAGDIETVRFRLADQPAGEFETWTRSGTVTIEGRVVSVFNPSWPNAVFARLRQRAWGWDYPELLWGQALHGDGVPVRLRIASTALPAVRVNRIRDDLQYSGHVVNMVVPDFGQTRFGANEQAFDLARVARRFYEAFEDTYDTIAVVPQDIHVMPSYHQTVKNEVSGVGLRVYDNSAAYGSRSGRLHAMELFTQAAYARNSSSAHEAAHQWGSYIDWTRLTNLVRAGHQPEAHDPLWAPGETVMGAVLDGTRQVKPAETSGWEVERSPGPILFHPYMLYAMGLLPKERVHEITLFHEQGQFGSNRAPAPGTAVTGETVTATIFNVIGMLGERSGPVPSEWHRALVVVSREGLLTQREMDYWTFFAQRTEDPNRTGVLSYDGQAPFDLATQRAIDLKHDIRPLTAERLVGLLSVDYPDFGARDSQAVAFDAPLPSRYRSGTRIRWSGAVTARDRTDFDEVRLRFTKYGGAASDVIRVSGRVSAAGTFIAETQFEAAQRGRYSLEFFLFWSGSGSQSARAALTPVFID